MHKDLNRLGRDLNKVIIVDDDPKNFYKYPKNGIQISPFNGKSDSVLESLTDYLIKIAYDGIDLSQIKLENRWK